MKKPAVDLLLPYQTSQKQATLIGNLIITLMMVSLGIGIVQLGVRLYPGWRGGYLVWVCLLVALEAIFTRKRISELEAGRERIIFHLSEWIAFAVLIKILLYVVNGPARLLADLPLWQEDFLENFFNAEYLIALVIALIIWFCSAAYSGELSQLYERENDAGWDELGKLQNAIHHIRDRVAARIFILGALVVGLAVFSRVDATSLVRLFGKPPPGYNAPVVNVLFYFILALILLSQTQFALLRTRWLWQNLPISPEIAKNWIKYGLAAFILLSVIVFFLPTEYSVGLFDTLRYILGFLMQVVTVLLVLITLPFSFCMSLLNLTTQSPTQTPQQPMQPPVLNPGAPSAPIGWLEFLRSLLFWVIFLGVIFFAIRYYLQQNTALWNAIIRFPLVRWIGGLWQALRGWVKGAGSQIAGLVETGVKRMRARRVALPTQIIRRVFNLARMSPREKIVYFYLSLVDLGGERGLARRPAQTPYQYEHKIAGEIPEIDPELQGLTEEFYTARYSQHPVDEPAAQKAGSLWERIKAILKSWKRPE